MDPRESWGAEDVVAQYATTGFSDPGEQAALALVAPQRRGRVLDLAVGGGRTTGLLLPGAASYLGLDVAEPMLAVARRRFPAADLREGDLRELEGLPAGDYDLVVCSFNSIDVLDHEQRRDALRAMAGLVAPDGRIVLSSLNLDGADFDERPWSLRGLPMSRVRAVVREHVRHPVTWARSVRFYQRSSLGSEDGSGWARRPLRAHGFRFLVHFATVGSTAAMLEQAGLEVVAAFTNRGEPLAATRERSDAEFVHYVCRRPSEDHSAEPSDDLVP